MNSNGMTLVTGGTGKTGSRIVQRLTERGLPVRVGSRGGDPRFDWDDRATWGPALEGVSAVYLAYYPDLTIPGAADIVGDLARMGAAAGVERVVLLSGRGEAEAQRAEREVQRAGTQWTVVRCGWFNQNFSESIFAEPLQEGVLTVPESDTPEPFVDADDIADVAVAALTEPGHGGQVYELTGPRLLTFAEAVAEIAEAAGRPIRYEPVTLDAYAAAMRDAGVPDDFVDLETFLFGELLDGRNAYLTDGVQRALGREPRDFREFARRAAATGVWSAARPAAA